MGEAPHSMAPHSMAPHSMAPHSMAPHNASGHLRSPGFTLLKTLLAGWKGAACSLGLAALGLFPAGAQARPEPCINTHSSLNLGCLTRDQWDRKIREWSTTPSWRHYREGEPHSGDFITEQLNETINLYRAYAHFKALMGEDKKPGEGVNIAIIHDGSVHPHPWFSDTTVTNMISPYHTLYFGRSASFSAILSPDGMTWPHVHSAGHGIATAGVAAGRYGVAPGADLTVFNYGSLPYPEDSTRPEYPSYKKDIVGWWKYRDDINDLPRYFKHVLSQDIDILYVSRLFGGAGYTIEDAVQGGPYGSNIRKNFRNTINVLAQKNAEEKKIIVWGAGNNYGGGSSKEGGITNDKNVCADLSDLEGPYRCLNPNKRGLGAYNASSPYFMAGLPALVPELRGHYIAAVAADHTKAGFIIGTYSNRCGIAADWCITAPVGRDTLHIRGYKDKEGNAYSWLNDADMFQWPKVDTANFTRFQRFFWNTKDKNPYHKKKGTSKVYELTQDNDGNFFMEGYTTSRSSAGKLVLGKSDGVKKKVEINWLVSGLSGTSEAAPAVAGSLAVMKSLFRGQLSNTELVTRLFATANKTGIYANRAIYGQGLLDLGAATNPWGVVGLMGPGQSVGAQAQGQAQQDSPGGSGEVEPSEANVCGKGTIKTHSSLELGCLTREKLNEKVQEWATAYRAVPGFAKQWGLAAINADRAYAHLKAIRGESVKPGQGVTIGFVDSGMDSSHPSFAASKVEQKLMRGATSANRSHGTAVASVAAGGRISSGPNQSKAHHGVAWGADIDMFAIPAEVYPVTRAVHPIKDYAHVRNDAGEWIPKPNKEMAGLFARDKADAKFFKSVLSEDMDILNLSFPSAPFPGTIDDYKRSRLQKNYRKTVAALAQKDKQEKTILVWSAGDVDPSRGQTPGSSPQLMAGLPARIKELRGHSIAVVATKEDGAIADFSNRCGRAADWCIAAPGQNVRVASSSSQGWGKMSSTSVAAPMVSGGLAVMKQLFRDQLSNTALVSRLFSTAKKDGIHADRSIYGQGLMDLGAATNPWGMAAFMGTGQAVGAQSRGDSVGQQGGGVELSSTSLSLGSAMGDGLSEALARQEIAAFDSLGAPFWFSAGSFTLPAEGPSLAARFQQFLAPAVEPTTPEKWQVDFQSGAPALEAGHLALTHGADRLSFHGPQGLSATLFQRSPDYDQAPLAGLAVSWNPQALPALSLAAGYLQEPEELLGSQGSGAFGELSGHTLFLSAELDTTTPQGWQLSAQGELGMVNPAVARSQFISDISTLTSSAFRLQARKPLENGAAFRLALSQPLRVESGAAALSLPTGRTKDGLVVGTDLSAPLSPSGRQLDLTAQLDLPLLGGELSLAATHSRQPQHQKGADHQWTFFTGYRANW